MPNLSECSAEIPPRPPLRKGGLSLLWLMTWAYVDSSSPPLPPLPSWERGMEARSQACTQKQPYTKAQLSPLSPLVRGAGCEDLDSHTTHYPSEPPRHISQYIFIPPFIKSAVKISP